MSHESLTVGFLLLFEEPSPRSPRIFDSSRSAFAPRFIRVERRDTSSRFSVATVPEFHGDELSRDVWPESIYNARLVCTFDAAIFNNSF